MNKWLRGIGTIGLMGIVMAACSPSNNLPQPTEVGNPILESKIMATAPPSPPMENDYSPNEVTARDYSELQIVSLLPRDAIPSIDDPTFLTAVEADEEYSPDELVMGVEFNGEARAYSVGLLSRHEIVNDTVGGIELAVTW